MKKKRILNEEVTRRLMKMANLDTFTEDFLAESEELEENDLEEGEELEEVEKVRGAHADHKLKNTPKSKRNHLEENLPPEDEMGVDPMGDAPAPPMDDPMDDMDDMDDMGMEDSAPTVESLIDAIVMTIEAEAPGYLDVQSDEPMEGPPTDDVPMDIPQDEPPMDDEMPPEMEEAGPRYKGATKEVPMEGRKAVDNKINEVAAYIASQVTNRLKNKKRK
jgi:hypothetical protein